MSSTSSRAASLAHRGRVRSDPLCRCRQRLGRGRGRPPGRSRRGRGRIFQSRRGALEGRREPNDRVHDPGTRPCTASSLAPSRQPSGGHSRTLAHTRDPSPGSHSFRRRAIAPSAIGGRHDVLASRCAHLRELRAGQSAGRRLLQQLRRGARHPGGVARGSKDGHGAVLRPNGLDGARGADRP